MAEIFKAQSFSHGGFEHLLAIKRILEHLSDDDEFIEMFIDEAKVSVALQHPNIVRIYDFGKILDNYFIAMECVEGKDLRDLLRKLARLRKLCPWRFCVHVAAEACRGLQYAHTKCDIRGRPYRIVHRDMSPSNIMVAYDGQVKIADFGIAKAALSSYSTQGGVLKGKYEYMSPEQASGEPLDHQSDLFSLGIVLHEMLTGRRLFRSDSDVETLKRIQAAEVHPPSKFNKAISPELDAIVARLLTVDKTERYQSADDVESDLRALIDDTAPHTLQTELSHYIKEVFAEEIADERQRLHDGSAVARQIRASMELTQWDEDTELSITETNFRPAQQGSNWPGIIGVTIIAILLAIGMSFGVSSLNGSYYGKEPASLQPSTLLSIVVLPAATVYVNHEELGTGRKFTLDQLPQGPHLIRFEAQGYQSSEHTVELRYGKPIVLPVVLEKDQPSSEQGMLASLVSLSTNPIGASVILNGVTIGTTPFTWTGGQVGSSYEVSISLDGFHTAKARIPVLKEQTNISVHRDLVSLSADYGNLTITLPVGLNAEVFVDDQHLSFSAPLSHPLAPGSYEIRVLNPAAGIRHTERVSIATGQTTMITVN